jgi:hypothetical protein
MAAHRTTPSATHGVQSAPNQVASDDVLRGDGVTMAETLESVPAQTRPKGAIGPAEMMIGEVAMAARAGPGERLG